MHALIIANLVLFLSTLSLRRATNGRIRDAENLTISIHALLAESDFIWIDKTQSPANFYPRSPCGERPARPTANTGATRFLSTLSLRRATREPTALRTPHHIFLSTLSLRRATLWVCSVGCVCLFLSTLSLRRATVRFGCARTYSPDFYPRSPCGERQTQTQKHLISQAISIHALLAESD